jgi:hypothetical protein
MIGQLFVQLYPNPACAPMHRHFVENYRQCTEVAEEVPMRKPAVMETAPGMAAAAVA